MRKQCVNLNNMQNTFKTLLSGAPQGSTLEPLLFNIFINDFSGFIKIFIIQFVDDNTITSFKKSITLEALQNEA